MKALMIGCLIIVGIAAPAAQEHKPDVYYTYGPGALSCGAFTQAAPPIVRHAYEWWAFGFVSGASHMFPRSLASTDTDGLRAWLTTYCAAHPLDMYVRAVETLVHELIDRAAVVQLPPLGGEVKLPPPPTR